MVIDYFIDGFTCIEQYLEYHAKNKPDAPAVIVKNDVTNYGQMWAKVKAFAYYLKTECELKKGECVCVRAIQSLDYAVAYFAVHLNGAVFVPLESSISNEKAADIIEETESRIYISRVPLSDEKEDSPNGESLKSLKAGTGSPDQRSGAEKEDIKYINIKTVCELAAQYEGTAWEHVFPELEDSADIMYTTGTTGRAKGVEVSHHVLLATAENYLTGMEWGRDNCMAVPGPLNHVNPLRKLYTSMIAGTSIVILNGLMSIKGFFDALDNHPVTSLCLPPASLRTIWKASGDKLAEYADRIDFVECSTAPVTESDKATLRAQLPKSRLYNNYGLSECGAMVMYDFNKYKEQPHGCVGKAMVNSHVVIVDDDHNIIESDSEHMGLVANKGPINMKGYYKHPEITATVKIGEYVYTSDIGYIDKDGFLYVIGRTNDTINVGGLKVEPTEVEEAAMLFPGMAECICVPVEDPVTGHGIKLFVVMKQGETFDEAALRKFLKERLENHQMPKLYGVLDSVPRNFVGKPDRKAFVNGELVSNK